MTESSLSMAEADREEPWNTPSVMGLSPLPPKPEVGPKLPRGSNEFEKIMSEMIEEIEYEKRTLSVRDAENREGRSLAIARSPLNVDVTVIITPPEHRKVKKATPRKKTRVKEFRITLKT